MDIDKLFKNVKNLNQYICVTEDVCRNFKDQKIQFNMSTVVSLQKVRSLEIEYFNKCDENGAAFVIMERMLELPPSKTWALLGKELISLAQYWLDATRKHLITHSLRWWLFLDFLLKFLKTIRLKDPVLPDMLVEGTTERLLDLATQRQPDELQRQAILHCINLCCAGSSRKIRFALRHHFDRYFVKLSLILATSGDLPLQHTILETLIHWLLPRQNLAVKQAAAAKWFPSNLYRRNTVNIFLQRDWKNFFQDARDFLNSHNEGSQLIVSVNCLKVTIGSIVALSGIQDRNVWLDVNSSSKSISILMHPKMLDALGVKNKTSFNYLIITEDNVQATRLCRQSNVMIVLKMLNNLVLYPSGNNVGAIDVCVELSSRTDLRRLDNGLRNILDGKYQNLLDFENLPPLSPCNGSRTVCETPDEDTRLSHPVQVPRRKHSGFMVRSKAAYLKSPSSTSTTSLALLHDRLSALPKFNFDKEPVKVSLLPTLSNVSEQTEVEDRHSFASCSTKKLRNYGVCYKGIANTEKKQQNDDKPPRDSSPVHNEHPTSCLLVATIGSDESVINNTLERLSRNKDYTNDNVVDLIIQEAFDSKENVLSDTGLNTGDNKYKKTQGMNVNIPNIKNTRFLEKRVPSTQNTKVQNVTSDDSNEIKETQYEFVNVRKRNLVNKQKEKHESNNIICVKASYEEEALEQFFSQHIVEDKQNGIIVSPTLARKINETSSESNCEINNALVTNEDYITFDYIYDNDVIDCLNNIVDKVCEDFDKCAEILNQDHSEVRAIDTHNTNAEYIENGFAISNIQNIDGFQIGNEKVQNKESTKEKGTIKLKFNTKSDRRYKNQMRKIKSKFNLASTKPMSPIPELKDSIGPDINKMERIEPEDTGILIKNAENNGKSPRINNRHLSPESDNLDTPLIRRKSKLHSSKGRYIENQKQNSHSFDTEHYNNTKSKTIEIIDEVTSPKNGVNSPEIKNINVSPGSDSSGTPLLVRRKRKLYSPKEEHIENKNENINISDLENANATKSKNINVKRSPKFTATCYKEIEKERKKSIRQPRLRITRSKGKDQLPSPRSKKMNELFDTLKENVERNQNIILADKKSVDQDLVIYNFTSDSDDSENFKKKKIEVKKRISMKLTGNESILPTRQTKWINRRNRTEKTPDKSVMKPVKQAKKSGSKKKPKQCKTYNLVDERMREAHPEEPNTSFILEKSAKVDKEPKLFIEAVPQMEVITDEDYDKLEKPKKIIRNKKNKADIKTKNQKSKIPNKKIDNDDRTISPLPELVVENVKVIQDDLNDSLSSQMIMKKFKETYKAGPDLEEPNKTQNLLDIDSAECNSHVMNVSNKIREIYSDELNNNINTVKSKDKNAKAKRNIKTLKEIDKEDVIETYTVTEIVHNESKTICNNHSNTINISSNSGGKSEKSINTVGKSPITAHGDMNETPPNFKLLNETVEPRNLELVNLDPSLKDYFLKLRDDINALPVSSRKTNIKRKQPIVLLEKIDSRKKEDAVSIKSPTVPITRLSSEDIHQWLPSKRKSESESSSSEKDFKPKTLKVSQLHRTSNINQIAVKSKTKCKEFENNKSSTYSRSSSNDTATKTSKKGIYKQKRLKSDRKNKNKFKSEDTNITKALHKHGTNNISEGEPELASRVLRTRNPNSNTDSVNNKKDNPFVSKTHTVLRPSSDSSTISSIKFDDIDPVNILHNDEKSQKNPETANNSRVINGDRKGKNNKAKTDTVSRQVDDIDNSVISSKRFDEFEPIITPPEDTKNSVTLNNPSKNNIANNNEKGKSFKTKTHEVVRPANNDHSAILSIREDDNKILNIQNNSEIIVQTLETSNDLRVEEKGSKQDVKRNNKRRSLSISSNRSKHSIRNDNSKTAAKSVLKRKSESPLSDFAKRRKPERVLSGSGPSVSSVNDWFKRNAPLSSAESISQSYTDTLQNVMEKLDTTVAEIHQNTSKKFIHLFVEVQQQLTELRTRKLNMFKQATADILSEVTSILEAKYADLETRSQQMDSEFTQLLKNLSSEIIKEDFTRKCSMVVLLKEDFQAVADHLAKKRES